MKEEQYNIIVLPDFLFHTSLKLCFTTLPFTLGMSLMIFIMLRYVFCIPTLIRVIIMNKWILSNAFSAYTEMVMLFLSFLLIMWYITLIDLQITNHSCILGINPTWSWRMILLIYYWIRIACILWVKFEQPLTTFFAQIS